MPTRQCLVGRVADLGLLHVQVAALVGGALDVGRLLVSVSVDGGDRLVDEGLGSSSIGGLGGEAVTNSTRWVARGVDVSRGVAGVVIVVVVVSSGRVLTETAVEMHASESCN